MSMESGDITDNKLNDSLNSALTRHNVRPVVPQRANVANLVRSQSTTHELDTKDTARKTGIFKVELPEHKERFEQFFPSLLESALSLERHISAQKGNRENIGELVGFLARVCYLPQDLKSQKGYLLNFSGETPRYKSFYHPQRETNKRTLRVTDINTGKHLDFVFCPNFDTDYGERFKWLNGESPDQARTKLAYQRVDPATIVHLIDQAGVQVDPHISISLRDSENNICAQMRGDLKDVPEKGAFADFYFTEFPEITSRLFLAKNKTAREQVRVLGHAARSLTIESPKIVKDRVRTQRINGRD